MPTEELKEFVEERLRAFDPTIDLTDGSPAEVLVVDPIVRRFEPDPFEMDVDKFITARLEQEYPDMDSREGAAVRDLLVKPNIVLLDPIQREVTLIKQNQSLAAPELLSPSEADALTANLFVRRSTGGLATGRARLYFNAPVAVTASLGNICYTADGLNFIPTSLQSISADAMLFNQEGNLYYFDISVTAEKPGEAYNIEKELLVGITNINTAVRVTNLDKFEGGLEEEDTESLVNRAEESLTERSMVVGRGVIARLRDQFLDLLHLQIVGFGDEEMNRDLITGGDKGDIILSGSDGYTDDDGDGDDETNVFRTRYTSLSPTFDGVGTVSNYWLIASEICFGSDGEMSSGTWDHFISASYVFKTSDVGLALIRMGATNPVNNAVAKIIQLINDHEVHLDVPGVPETGIKWFLARPAKDYEIVEILTDQSLKVAPGTPLPISGASFVWEVRRKELTISDIPGGIVVPTIGNIITVQADQVHIGGHSDFFVRGTGLETAQMTLTSITDEAPLIDKQTLDTDLIGIGAEYVQDSTVDFFSAGVKPGYSLIIETGPNAGTRTILKVTAAQPNLLQVYPVVVSSALGQKYRIIDDIDIDMRDPRNIKGQGVDLRTLQLSNVVTTTSAQDFTLLGVSVGDTLRIKIGPDKGDYLINQITGTGNKKLVLGATLTSTESGLGWEIFTKQTGMDFPLVRIQSLDLLDSSKQPTGETVPYAHPVDIRTSTFSNMGRGTKVSITDAVTGIVGSVNLAGVSPGSPLPICSIDIRINHDLLVTTTVNLTGSMSKEEIVTRINTASEATVNIADILDVQGEARLVLRSRNRWIEVLPGPTNSTVGFSNSDGEDNRQIKSAGAIADWTIDDYDLRVMRDVVSIQTGDNIGNLYLLAVKPNRLLVFGVDEDEGAAVFLQPNAGIIVNVGSRSYGTARLYFMDPTSCSVRGAWRPPLVSSTKNPANLAWTENGNVPLVSDEPPLTYFTASVNGALMRFVPDPDLRYQLLPPPSEDVPNNLQTPSSGNWVRCNTAPSSPPGQVSRCAAVDFLRREILAGDVLEITYVPVQGVHDLTDPDLYSSTLPVPATCLKGKTLIMSVEGSPPKVCTFSDQIASASDVIDEINETFGLTIAYLEQITSPSAETLLRFEADVDFVVFGNGTANGVTSPVSTLLGLGSVTKNNQAPAHIDGDYTILEVAQTTQHDRLYVVKPDGVSGPGVAAWSQHFKIHRPGLQRLHTGGMAARTELGFYYMDVELVSEGVGDQNNLAKDLQLSITGHESDGYSLYTPDEDLTFSEEEELTLTLSRRILLPTVTDNPANATNLYNYNLQVKYSRSPLAAQVQSFASSELERVLTANILVRHLMPHFVSFALNYQGGSTADIVQQDILDYLEGLSPTDRVEVSALTDLVKRRGASYVQNPVTLIAVAHQLDRTIVVDRSQDYVSVGRLATFFPDNITITRETSTVL